jgi:hypothetical protein
MVIKRKFDYPKKIIYIYRMKSKTFDDLLKSITPEMEEKWKQDRIKEVKSLTTEQQLGFYVGIYIVDRYLPTLSTDGLHSKTLIKVSEEDEIQQEKLMSEWFSTTKHGSNWDGNENGNKEKWDLCVEHNKMLEKKYLPEILECFFHPINIIDEEDFKKGLILSLWNCDMCSYSIKPEDILIKIDDDYYSTIISLKLV